MFIKTYDKKIINVDNMADISLDMDSLTIISRSPKAVNYNYELFKLSYRISETTNAIGDEYYVITNPYFIEYYQAVLFETLEETVAKLDLDKGTISVPDKDVNGEYIRNVNPETGELEYSYSQIYTIICNENGEYYMSPDTPSEDQLSTTEAKYFYILQPTTVTVTQKDEGLYVLTPSAVTHVVNATVIKDYIYDLYNKIKKAIFEDENIDIYEDYKNFLTDLYKMQTMIVYKEELDEETTTYKPKYISSKYLMTNNKGFAVLEDNSYVYVNYLEPVIDPETGEPEIDEEGKIIYDTVPLRIFNIEYVLYQGPHGTEPEPDPEDEP